jgi:hypothetical protein
MEEGKQPYKVKEDIVEIVERAPRETDHQDPVKHKPKASVQDVSYCVKPLPVAYPKRVSFLVLNLEWGVKQCCIAAK